MNRFVPGSRFWTQGWQLAVVIALLGLVWAAGEAIAVLGNWK